MGRIHLKFLLCMWCLMTSLAAPAQQTLSLDLIDLAAISRMTPQQLEALAEGLAMQEIMRTKRSSAQAITSAVSKASSAALQSKVGLLGQASSGALSYAASASSKSSGYDEHHGYNYEPHESKVDFWGLKKSILYTLFQAVKAITGGVTILKGQLIKGGGALAAKLGTAISGKGDLVSNFGKKIVKSAALSEKKPHSTPVYGPPPSHVDYIPSSYGAPTAPAHYHHSAPSAPSGYGPSKYTSHLDGRGKPSGVQAGLLILAPLHGEEASDTHYAPSSSDPGHTPLEPPPSLLHSAFTAIKNVFSSAAPTSSYSQDYIQAPPVQPSPPFQQHAWGAVNSYGEPAAPEAYPDYDRNTHAHSKVANLHSVHSGLTADKLQKISDNLDKIANLQLQRSSEELPRFDGLDVYRKMLMKGMKTPLLPTPVVTDEAVGEIPADLQPSEVTSTIYTMPSTTTTTTVKGDTGVAENTRRRKDIKYVLRGNKIVEV